MDFHIWAELLSCWFHFRITLPHIYWVSDYFWIKTGRDWTITWTGEQCFDTPRICNIVLLNPTLSNTIEYHSVYDSSISLLWLHIWKIKTLFCPWFLGCLWEEVASKEKARSHQPLCSPCTKFHCTIAWKSTPASTRALEICADCWKWTLSAGRERKHQVANSFSSFWYQRVGKAQKKGMFKVLGLSIPFSPRQVSCGKQHCFIEVNVTVLPLMLLFCQ